MTEKNELLRATVEGLGSNGEGVIRHEGNTFFVPYCLCGEEVEFRVLKIKNGIGYGKVEKILTPSTQRTTPKCPVFYRCGGCQLQHMDYESQLDFKGAQVENALKKIAGISFPVKRAQPSERVYGYRNKLQLPIGVDKDGNTVLGFYAERSHRIVPIERCYLHPEWSEKLIAAIQKYAQGSGEKGYDELNKTGSLRHIVVRELDGKYIVTLVTAKKNVKDKEYLIGLLQGVFPTFTLWHNYNREETNYIFGEKFSLLYGTGFFEAEEKGIEYEAGPQTFVQVNAGVRGKLYEEALKTVTGTGDEVVIDGYSGGGLLTAMIAKRAKRVYGIEIEQEAVDCANSLKKKNGLDNMTNICGAVEDELRSVLEMERGEKVRLILDPPRAGIARSVLYALKKSGIEELTIISCNPATLARDLGILTGALKEKDGGLEKSEADGEYEIKSVEAFDMFPMTKHVESIARLVRKA